MKPSPKTAPWVVALRVAIALTIGVPAAAFLFVATWGAITAPLGGAALLAPFVLVNYALWRRWLA
jgi:hypothetical protein